MSFDLKIIGGDLSIGPTGDILLVYDNDKLKQDIIKILLTKPGDNKFHSYYGSNVGMLEIGYAADEDFLMMDLESSVEQALRTLMRLQQNQGRSQYLTPGEIIADIVSVSSERDFTDPRLYNIYISVLTQRLQPLDEVITVRIV